MPIELRAGALRPRRPRRRCATRWWPAKAGDPLAPVTRGRAHQLRRRRGAAPARQSGALGRVTDGGDGVAGVTFLTVYRLAELLGAPRLAAAHRRPVSTPVLAAAVRGGARRRARACSARSPSTRPPRPRSSTRTASCRTLDDAALDALVRTERARGRRRAHQPARARRSLAAEWYDERDLMDTAAAAVGAGVPLLADLGAVVLYLPQELSTPARRAAARARRRACPSRSSPASPAYARADAPVRAALARLDLELPERRRASTPRRRHARSSRRRIPTTKCAPSVRLVIDARCATACRSSAWRCSTAPPSRTPASCTSSSTAAGIPHNGAAVRTLADSVLGRGLLGLLALPDRDFQRHDVMRAARHRARSTATGRAVPQRALGAHQPARPRSCAAPSTGTQRLERLRRASSRRELAAERAVTDRDPRPERYERELDATPATLAGLRRRPGRATCAVDPGRELARPRRLGRAARPRPPRARVAPRRRGPRSEQQAAEKIEAALDRLAGLDAVEAVARASTCSAARSSSSSTPTSAGSAASATGCSWATSRSASGSTSTGSSCAVWPRALFPDPRARRLAAPRRRPPRHRRRAPAARGPGRRRPPPPARRARRRVGAARPPLPARRPAPHHRARAVAVPRSRASTALDRHPSGSPTTSASSHADWYTPVPSFAAGLARVEFPATEQEHRLRTLLDHTARRRRRRRPRARAASTARSRAASTPSSRARAARSPASTATSPASPSRASPTATWSCRRRGSQT